MTPDQPANELNRVDDHSLSQAILDTLTSHVAVVDVNGEIVAVNKAWRAFAAANGDPRLASIGVGANYLDVAKHAAGPYSEEGQAAYLGIQAVLDGSLPQFTLEYPCHAASVQRWFLLTASPLAGTPNKAVLSHHDISSRRQAENQLRESEEQFRELALHLHQVLWIIDAKEAKVIYISPGYEKLWGRSSQSLIDRPQSYLEGIHPLDQEMMIREDAAMYETGHIDAEFRILHPDKSVRWAWVQGFPVRDAQGQLVRLVGVAEDITERKVAEDDQARLAAIVECSEDAIVSSTVEGMILTWNDGAERLYGYLAEEIIGRSIRCLYTPEGYQEYLRSREIISQGDRIPSYETIRLKKDGTPVNVSVSLSPILVKGEEVIGTSSIAHDITNVKLLEEQFRQSQKMEAVGTLAGGVAHDFNNLLTVINGYSEMLIGDLADDDPMRATLIEIYKAGERAGNLTRQLLAFSRKQVLKTIMLNLNAVIVDTEEMLRRLIGEDIVLTTVLDPALRPIRADPGQIEQVLMNLAVNARDAMPQGGRLTFETRHVVLDNRYRETHYPIPSGEYSMVAVTDTGTGMDEATRGRIFEPFFTTKEEGKGTGLGMAVVHGIVTQSGGEIEVHSELDIGTVFKVYFPLAKDALLEGKPTGVTKMPQGTETILLVEDDAAVRALARHLLQSCGYTLLEATNGLEAIDVVQGYQEPIHLVVSDVVMPHMGGRQLADRLKIMLPGVKILFLSGYTDDAVIRHGILESEVAFLQKPFSPTALAQKVRDVLYQTT